MTVRQILEACGAERTQAVQISGPSGTCIDSTEIERRIGFEDLPTAGAFMTGFFPIMMFALPAAALAIYHEASPARRRVVGGVMLGLGRALGETMAVTFVIGNANRMPTSLFSPGTSIASTLANEFGEAADFHISALFALGFLLFVITFIVLGLAKWMLVRAERAKGF